MGTIKTVQMTYQTVSEGGGRLSQRCVPHSQQIGRLYQRTHTWKHGKKIGS